MKGSDEEFITQYWLQYIALEKEFISTMQYVTVSKENYTTYSAAYVKLLLQIGSEVDIVSKRFCIEVFNYTASTIDEYRNCFKTNLPQFTKQKVEVLNNSIVLSPWDTDKSLLWWTVYNKVKHNRTEEKKIDGEKKLSYKFANLKYTLNALAGYYQLLVNFYYQKFVTLDDIVKIPLPGSRLFRLSGDIWDAIDFPFDFALHVDNKTGQLIQVCGNPY